MNDTSVFQEAIHTEQTLIFSMEFECSTCSVNNVRMVLGNGTMGYLTGSSSLYSWSADLIYFSDTARLSHKCYNHGKNWTYVYYLLDVPSDEAPSYARIHDPASSTGIHRAAFRTFRQ